MKKSSIFEETPHLIEHSISQRKLTGKIHFHEKNELLFLMEGSLTEICNTQKVEIEAPAVMILPANSIHFVTTKDASVYHRYKLFFDVSLVECDSPLCKRAGFFKGKDLVVIKLNQEQKGIFITLFERIEAYRHDPAACDQLVLWILYELSYLKDSFENPLPLSSPKPYVNKLTQYLSDHYGDSITLESLAGLFFVSRAKLAADFKTSTGLTVGAYLTLIRMNNAKKLLKSGQSVTQVAHLCGYSDESHFIELFKKQFGITPKKYSQECKKA